MTNTKHQLGVEAARSGQRRDERMSAEWLEGFDAENDISAGEKVFRGADERKAVVTWLRAKLDEFLTECHPYESLHVRGAIATTVKNVADRIERGEHIEGAK